MSALKRVADRIRGYAGDDRELRQVIDGLRDEGKQFALQLNESSLKHASYMSSNMSRMRTVDGKARKRPSESR